MPIINFKQAFFKGARKDKGKIKIEWAEVKAVWIYVLWNWW
jgi:hypothetical protein